MNSINIISIMTRINSWKANSAWNRGVKLYAMEILSNIKDEGQNELSFDENGKLIQKTWTIHGLTQGFDHWVGCSQSGQFEIYDREIALRLCTASELQKTKFGERNPSKRETWIECQGRALFQARNLIAKTVTEMMAK